MPYSRATTAPWDFRPAHLHHQAAGGQEQWRPARVGRRGDQDLAGLQVGADRVEHDPGRRGDRAGRGRAAGQRPVRPGALAGDASGSVPSRQQQSRDVPAAKLERVRRSPLGHQIAYRLARQCRRRARVVQEEDVVGSSSAPRSASASTDDLQLRPQHAESDDQQVLRALPQSRPAAAPGEARRRPPGRRSCCRSGTRATRSSIIASPRPGRGANWPRRSEVRVVEPQVVDDDTDDVARDRRPSAACRGRSRRRPDARIGAGMRSMLRCATGGSVRSWYARVSAGRLRRRTSRPSPDPRQSRW